MNKITHEKMKKVECLVPFRENSGESDDDKLNHDLGGDRLIEDSPFVILAEQYKIALVNVTSSLKAYAETFHFHIHSQITPFVTCQEEPCITGRKAIDKAIAIVAKEGQ